MRAEPFTAESNGWLGSNDSEPPAELRAPVASRKHHIQGKFQLRWGLAMLEPSHPLKTTKVNKTPRGCSLQSPRARVRNSATCTIDRLQPRSQTPLRIFRPDRTSISEVAGGLARVRDFANAARILANPATAILNGVARSRRCWALVLVGWFLGFWIANIWAQGNATPQTGDADHAARSIAAADLAILAAQSGIIDISLEAMKRAVGKGPPVSSVDLGGLLSSQPRQTSSSRNADPIESAQTKIAKRLLKLNAIWLDSQIEPATAYQAWKQTILPKDRATEAFAYSVEGPLNRSYSYGTVHFEFDQPRVTDCGAAALVDWARRADQVDDLRAEIARRKSFSGAATTTLLLQMILAQHAESPDAEREALCRRLCENPAQLIDETNAKLLCGHAWKMASRLDADNGAKQQWVAAILKATETRQQWPANDWIQYLVAENLRATIEENEPERFREMATVAISRYARLSANNAQYVASRESAMYGEAARRAFQEGHIQLGADCLRAQSLITTSDRYGSSSSAALVILDPNQPVHQQLLTTNRGERFPLLDKLVWSMPAVGLQSCARMSSFDRVPDVFTKQLSTPSGPSRFNEIAQRGSLEISLLGWTIRDALATGNEEHIEKRIADIEAQGSDDAKLARLVLGLVKDQPIDFDALMEEPADGASQFVPCLGTTGPVTPLDLEIARRALASADHQSAALEFLGTLVETAKQQSQYPMIAWARYLRSEGKQRIGAAQTLTAQDLRHWVVADLNTADQLMSGHVPSSLWWEREPGVWGHEYGTHLSHLLFRYPLHGDFSFSLRVKDGNYEEGGVTICGMVVDLERARGRIQLTGMGERSAEDVTTRVLQEDEYNAASFSRHGDTLTVQLLDNKVEQAFACSNAFPFLGLFSHDRRASSFDSLRIDGDVSIPRSVNMLSPELLGWSTMFVGQRLPGMSFMPGDSAEVPQPNGQIDYDWQVVDGNLESVDHTKLALNDDTSRDQDGSESQEEPPRREALIQYVRPLCHGEQVSLEFLYVPEQFSVAPCIGRIAMDLSEPTVGLHWVTADKKGTWTGVDELNRVVDEEAQQPTEVNLKENDWNKIEVGLTDSVVTLRVNGQLAYSRDWEPAAGRQFGLFHDPQRYHVRVRNIVLTGNWPDRLPEELFEVNGD